MNYRGLLAIVAAGAVGTVLGVAEQVRNGSFEELDKDGKPKFWSLRGKSQIVKTGNGNALKLGGSAYQNLAYYRGGVRDELNQQPYPRKIAYSFTASGKGKLHVDFVRYTDTPDPKAKHGYRRKIHKSTPADKAFFTYVLTEKPQLFSGEYTIKANEWVGFFLIAADAVVDDVSLRLVK